MNKTIVSGQTFEKKETLESADAVGMTFKDVLTTVKMGIVNSNLITVFTGVWLALYFTQQPISSFIFPVLFVLVGTGLIIAGGCSLNNYIDRDIDQLMERTQERPSATGRFEGKKVLTMGIILSFAGLAALFAASQTSALFGLIGLIVYVIIYTLWLKRTHSINTIVGSIAGAVPPIIGWAAIDPSLNSPVPWLLFMIMFLWQPPHFLALAIKRVEEYRRAGIPMLPVVAGFGITKRQMIIYVAVLVPVSLLLYSLGAVYTAAAVILGFGWLALSVYGLYTKDTVKWSRIMFVASLNYMTLLFLAMIVSTFL
ncbi:MULTISPECIES: heme o synthase [unclassified Sporolactobacillus]|uniref:heme o synthase n=1 Tax=unclassified Sporolactobacillus TaxID=2628533 RepID=UPI002367816F|nr:heme o synthase [Sporolactobacillus sp. CQH2019]MDD9147182.1 heme o synthase [Sporolactobacillus sp. CQH2019]